jgi:hypothetical protein
MMARRYTCQRGPIGSLLLVPEGKFDITDPELGACLKRPPRAGMHDVGSPRIHGELLKLGFDVAQSTVAKYMVRRLRHRRDGRPFSVIMPRTSAPSTCLSYRPLASSCSMVW